MTPFNSCYSMELCPAFWKWIDDANERGIAFSIHKVKLELVAFGDGLSHWAKDRDEDFFLKFDEGCLEKFEKVTAFVNGSQYFSQANKADFYSKADCYLIAHALAHGFTVVTFEKAAGYNTSKVKIPAICSGLGVPCMNLWELLRVQKVKLS